MSSERSLIGKARAWFGQCVVIPLAMWRGRKVRDEVWSEMATFRLLCAEWHRLANEDHHRGVRFDDPMGAGHLAYLEVEREHARLYSVPLPCGAYGWVTSGGGLNCGSDSVGALADAMRWGYKNQYAPVSRRVAYLAMGWEYEPPPTGEQMEHWALLSKAMWRIGTSHSKEIDVMGMKVHSTVMGKDYFTELVANMREIEAEKDA